MEYICPLCRQMANCVLPVITFTKGSARKSTTENETGDKSRPSSSSLISSSLSTIPTKLWILSSIIDRQFNASPEPKFDDLSASFAEPIYDQVLHLLRTRSFSAPEIVIFRLDILYLKLYSMTY